MSLLEQAGLSVDVPEQTCCGQPNYNAGDEDNARRIARQVIETFEAFDYVVVPSGSCAGMIKVHYPSLFADDGAWRARARRLADNTHELLSFLYDVVDLEPESPAFAASATYHDSCSGLRELQVQPQPRALLSQIADLTLKEMDNANVCCGFGGTFCVKYPEISTRMVDEKIAGIVATGADTVLGGDLGCLMNIAGRLRRRGVDVRVYHTAEVLAGMTNNDGIAG